MNRLHLKDSNQGKVTVPTHQPGCSGILTITWRHNSKAQKALPHINSSTQAPHTLRWICTHHQIKKSILIPEETHEISTYCKRFMKVFLIMEENCCITYLEERLSLFLLEGKKITCIWRGEETEIEGAGWTRSPRKGRIPLFNEKKSDAPVIW